MGSLEQRFVSLMEDRRFRIAGIVTAAVVFAASMGLLLASKGPVRTIATGRVLPDVAPVLAVLRASPYPEVRVMELRQVAPALTSRVSSPVALSARSSRMISRR